jgi:hypothetical protein
VGAAPDGHREQRAYRSEDPLEHAHDPSLQKPMAAPRASAASGRLYAIRLTNRIFLPSFPTISQMASALSGRFQTAFDSVRERAGQSTERLERP